MKPLKTIILIIITKQFSVFGEIIYSEDMSLQTVTSSLHSMAKKGAKDIKREAFNSAVVLSLAVEVKSENTLTYNFTRELLELFNKCICNASTLSCQVNLHDKVVESTVSSSQKFMRFFCGQLERQRMNCTKMSFDESSFCNTHCTLALTAVGESCDDNHIDVMVESYPRVGVTIFSKEATKLFRCPVDKCIDVFNQPTTTTTTSPAPVPTTTPATTTRPHSTDDDASATTNIIISSVCVPVGVAVIFVVGLVAFKCQRRRTYNTSTVYVPGETAIELDTMNPIESQ